MRLLGKDLFRVEFYDFVPEFPHEIKCDISIFCVVFNIHQHMARQWHPLAAGILKGFSDFYNFLENNLKCWHHFINFPYWLKRLTRTADSMDYFKLKILQWLEGFAFNWKSEFRAFGWKEKNEKHQLAIRYPSWNIKH